MCTRFPAGPGIVGPIAAQRRGGLPVELVGVKPGFGEQFDGPAVPLPEHPQQKMAAAHLAVAQAQGFPHGQLHDFFQPRGQAAAEGEGRAGAQGGDELILHPPPGDAQIQ